MAKLAIDVVLNKAAAMTGLRGMEKDITSFGKAALGLAGLGGGLAGFVAGIDNILAKAGQLQDVSDAFNVSSESIQRLANVGVTANLSIEEIGSKLGKLGKAAQDAAGGNTNLAKTFEKIGVTGQQLVSLSPEQLFNKLREAVSSGALAGEDLKVVNDLLARDYQRFLPILRMTTEEFERLGGATGVMSDAMVSNLDAANVKVRQFQQAVGNMASSTLADFIFLAQSIKENPLEFVMGNMSALDKMSEKIKKTERDIVNERKARAGLEKNVVDEKKIEEEQKAFEKSEQAAARHELKLIESQISGKEEAEKIKAAIEEKYRQRSLDREIEMEKKKNEQKTRLQDLLAKEGGPMAEMALLESRAQDAAKAFKDMPSTDTATALAEARGALGAALAQQINDQPSASTAPKGFAESEAQRRLKEQGLGADLSGFTQKRDEQEKAKPFEISQADSGNFSDSLKTSIESLLKQDGMQADVSEFAQKIDFSRPLEKLPDMAANLVAASKTLDQILEEIKKGDGSVFR